MVQIMDKLTSQGEGGQEHLETFIRSMFKTKDHNKVLDSSVDATRALEGLLFDCPDKTAQFCLSQVVKYALCFFRDQKQPKVVQDFLDFFKDIYLKQFQNEAYTEEKVLRLRNLSTLFSIVLAVISKKAEGVKDQHKRNLQLSNQEEPREAVDDEDAIMTGAQIYWDRDMLDTLARFMLQNKIDDNID